MCNSSRSNPSKRYSNDHDEDEPRDRHAENRDRKYLRRRGGTWGVHGRAYIRSITDAIVKRARKAEVDIDGRRE